MFRSYRMLSFFLLIVIAVFFAAGCFSKPAQDTKTPISPQIGVIDMTKAIKAHPKYQQLTVLQQQYNYLAAKLESRQSANMNRQNIATGEQSVTPLPKETEEDIGAALDQEYTSRMAARQAQLNADIDRKAAETRKKLDGEQQAYNEELDQQYQTQIFSLQLKLKTVQLGKEEMAALTGQLEQLQKERAAKEALKEKALAARLDSIMLAEKSSAEEQLATFSQRLHEELSQKASARSAEIETRNQTVFHENPVSNDSIAPSITDTGEDEKNLVMKKQEIDSLQQSIISDIRDKAAKVAVEQGLDAVLANFQVNITAVDITTTVIRELDSFSPRLQY